MSDEKYSVSIGPGNRIGALAVGPGARAEGEVHDFAAPQRIIDDTVISSAEVLLEAFDMVVVEGWLHRKWRWDFETVKAPGGDGWLVSVSFQRPDRETQLLGEGRSRPLFVRKGATGHDVWRTAYRLIALTLEHELDEAFHVGGRRVFDPHGPMLGKEGT